MNCLKCDKDRGSIKGYCPECYDIEVSNLRTILQFKSEESILLEIRNNKLDKKLLEVMKDNLDMKQENHDQRLKIQSLEKSLLFERDLH